MFCFSCVSATNTSVIVLNLEVKFNRFFYRIVVYDADKSICEKFWRTYIALLFANVDINYRGSTGFGRTYRQSLAGAWGIADVEDSQKAIEYLAAEKKIDAKRCIIRGGSAGGYTVLSALTFTDTFKAGASLYGIGDLETLATDTHKFESRYMDSLIGPYPERKDIYTARSPIHHAEGLNCPVIFLQGLEDKVVPPNQAEMMVKLLEEKGIKVGHITFADEGHGFRKAANIIRAMESELDFYTDVFNLAEIK